MAPQTTDAGRTSAVGVETSQFLASGDGQSVIRSQHLFSAIDCLLVRHSGSVKLALFYTQPRHKAE